MILYTFNIVINRLLLSLFTSPDVILLSDFYSILVIPDYLGPISETFDGIYI